MSRSIELAEAALRAAAEAGAVERTPVQAALLDALRALLTLAREQDAAIAGIERTLEQLQAPVPIQPDARY